MFEQRAVGGVVRKSGGGRMSWLRKALWSVFCALALCGASPAFAQPPTAASPQLVAPLAESWSWDQFWKFWKTQFGKTSGVVGVVLLVGAAAMAIIITKTRR